MRLQYFMPLITLFIISILLIYCILKKQIYTSNYSHSYILIFTFANNLLISNSYYSKNI